MTIKRERNISIVMILALVFSMILPQIAMAYTTKGDVDNPSLTIYKFERPGDINETIEGNGDSGQTPPAGSKPLAGVTYEVTKTHSYNLATDKWTEEAGAPFELTTGEDGSVSKTDMELGRFTVQEVAGPDHVVLNDQVFSVDIPMTNKAGNQLNYDVHIYPKNETILGAVELTKTGEAGEALVGAEFELYKGTPPNVAEKIGGTYTTGTDGKFSVNDLAYGDYYFVETKAPEGHVLNTTPIELKIEKTGEVKELDGAHDGVVVEEAMSNFIIPEIEKSVSTSTVNRDEEFTYSLKVTLPKDIKDYTEFTVTDKLDERLSYTGSWTVDNPIVEAALGFDDTGLTWSVIDFAALDSIENFTIFFTAKINPDAELGELETGIDNTATIEFDNGRGGTSDPNNPPSGSVIVTPTDGDLKIEKVDAKDNDIKLPGAVFDLKNKNGSDVNIPIGSLIKVNNEVVTSLNGLITGTNGELNITGLAVGDYKLIETKAPVYTDENNVEKPYRLLTKPVDVTVSADEAENILITVENSKSGWNLPTTGGIGTILFTVVGIVFMGFALFLLFRRDKKADA